MYETRPDLKSYVYAFRRLWWIPAILAILAVVAGATKGGAKVDRGVAELQLQDPMALAAVGSMTNPYDIKSLTVQMSDALNSGDVVEDLTAEVGLDPTVIDVHFPIPDGDLDAAAAAANEHVAEIWGELFSSTVAPARVWMAEAVERLNTKVSELDGVSGDAAALERADIQESLAKVYASAAALDSIQNSRPVLRDVESVGSPGGWPKAIMMVGGALFVGCGIVITIGLLDQRVRRRSLLERNGLTVVAVHGPGSADLGVVPAGLVAAGGGSTVGDVLIAGCGPKADTDGLRSALVADELIGDVVVVTDLFERTSEFIRSARAADVVVISVPYAGSDYVTVLEAARVAVTSGAKNVCAVLEVSKTSGLGEALS